MQTIEQLVASNRDYDSETVELEDQKIPKITPQIKEALQKFKSLKKLYIVACNLRSLENFPSIPTLEELDLTDNKLKGDELAKLPAFPNLITLTLVNNNIGNADDLKHLATFNKSLKTLNIDGCPLAQKDDYRKLVFKTVGGVLNVVDLEDQKGRELAEDSEEEQEDDEENQDEEDDVISDEDQESAPLPGKRPAPRGSSGKKQPEQIDASDQDQKENEEDSQDQEDDDNQEEEEESESEVEDKDKGPRKQTKRS